MAKPSLCRCAVRSNSHVKVWIPARETGNHRWVVNEHDNQNTRNQLHD